MKYSLLIVLLVLVAGASRALAQAEATKPPKVKRAWMQRTRPEMGAPASASVGQLVVSLGGGGLWPGGSGLQSGLRFSPQARAEVLLGSRFLLGLEGSYASARPALDPDAYAAPLTGRSLARGSGSAGSFGATAGLLSLGYRLVPGAGAAASGPERGRYPLHFHLRLGVGAAFRSFPDQSLTGSFNGTDYAIASFGPPADHSKTSLLVQPSLEVVQWLRPWLGLSASVRYQALLGAQDYSYSYKDLSKVDFSQRNDVINAQLLKAPMLTETTRGLGSGLGVGAGLVFAFGGGGRPAEPAGPAGPAGSAAAALAQERTTRPDGSNDSDPRPVKNSPGIPNKEMPVITPPTKPTKADAGLSPPAPAPANDPAPATAAGRQRHWCVVKGKIVRINAQYDRTLFGLGSTSAADSTLREPDYYVGTGQAVASGTGRLKVWQLMQPQSSGAMRGTPALPAYAARRGYDSYKSHSERTTRPNGQDDGNPFPPKGSQAKTKPNPFHPRQPGMHLIPERARVAAPKPVAGPAPGRTTRPNGQDDGNPFPPRNPAGKETLPHKKQYVGHVSLIKREVGPGGQPVGSPATLVPLRELPTEGSPLTLYVPDRVEISDPALAQKTPVAYLFYRVGNETVALPYLLFNLPTAPVSFDFTYPNIYNPPIRLPETPNPDVEIPTKWRVIGNQPGTISYETLVGGKRVAVKLTLRAVQATYSPTPVATAYWCGVSTACGPCLAVEVTNGTPCATVSSFFNSVCDTLGN